MRVRRSHWSGSVRRYSGGVPTERDTCGEGQVGRAPSILAAAQSTGDSLSDCLDDNLRRARESYGPGKRGSAPPDPIGRATAQVHHLTPARRASRRSASRRTLWIRRSRSAPAQTGSLPSMSEVGCLRRVEVVPRHLGQTKVDVGAVDALRILLDIETATPRATRADVRGPS